MTLKILTRSAAVLLISFIATRAGDRMEKSADSSVQTDTGSAVKSSVSPVQPLSLLPEKLGPMESILWSEHGFMRNHFDFPLTEDSREKEMNLRRTMLTAHEIGGFTTLAAMVTTLVVGQMLYNDYPYTGSQNLNHIKSTLGWATVFLYFGTASLSILTPPPMVRHNEWSTISTHKLLATIHFTGMILTPLLAAEMKQGHNPNHTPILARNVETLHMVSGYATTAAFAAAMLVVTF